MPSFTPYARFSSSSRLLRRSATRSSVLMRAERGRGVGKLRGAARAGDQVRGERAVAVARQPARHRADVVGQAAVLVDDEHRALRGLGRRPGAGHRAGAAGEGVLGPGARRGDVVVGGVRSGWRGEPPREPRGPRSAPAGGASLLHDASRVDAATVESPSRPSLCRASRREMSPSAWSSAISVAR